MPVNTAILALVLIFIPGILCYGVVVSLASKRTRDNTTTLLQIFMYGVASYIALAMFNGLCPAVSAHLGIGTQDILLLNPFSIEKTGIKPAPIAAASVVGLVFGMLISLNINLSLLMRVCRAAGLTRRFGDADVWSFLMNSDTTDNWVTVRHKDRGHIYQGYISQFSGGDRERELVLILVQVYDLESREKLARFPSCIWPSKRTISC